MTERRIVGRPALFWAFALSLIGLAAGRADEPTPEGFTRLYNGKDLTGWVEVQGKPGTFLVREGELVGTRKFRSAYWLSTDKKFGDFELQLEYLLPPGGNSGVFLRVPDYTGRTSEKGMEIQLLDDGAKTGKPTDRDTGAVYRVVGASKFVSRPAGQWNKLHLRLKGPIIQITLNGETINTVDMEKFPALQNRPRTGYIGLSAHTHEVRFRNIFLKPL